MINNVNNVKYNMMEQGKIDLNMQLKDLGFERAKTSLRMHFEAQSKVIKGQIGELEEVRASLGLSQRKMAQLLMVDPSAWTRWTRIGEDAPPHIWRALQWYMTLREKIPGLTPQYFIGADSRVLHEQALQKIEEEKLLRQKWSENLSQDLDTQEFIRRNESDLLKKQIQDLQHSLTLQKKFLAMALLFSLISFSFLIGSLI